MIDLFELGTYRFTLINLIDVLLVLLISIQLYKLLKGSLAFNILIGLVTIYLFGVLVRYFEMPLLEGILSQFAQRHDGFFSVKTSSINRIRSSRYYFGSRFWFREKLGAKHITFKKSFFIRHI